MKTNLLPQLLASLTVAILAPALPIHAGPVLPEVGPTPPGDYEKVSCGYLKVYSRTQQSQWGEGSYYYLHTPYWIYNSSGKRIRTVDNNSTGIDETPEKVELPPGRYIVRAWSDDDGLVTVPVVIKLARTTSVNLEEGRDQSALDESRAVKTPSGQFVGWKS